jgi:hypothetical protein
MYSIRFPRAINYHMPMVLMLAPRCNRMGYCGLSFPFVVMLGGIWMYVDTRHHRMSRARDIHHHTRTLTHDTAVRQLLLDESPSWLRFADTERAEWLNQSIAKIWPYYTRSLDRRLRESLNPLLKNIRPSALNRLEFTKIDLGEVPPVITGIKCYNTNEPEIIWDIDIRMAGESDVQLSVGIGPVHLLVRLQNLTLFGTFRQMFSPLVDTLPCFAAMPMVRHYDINIPSDISPSCPIGVCSKAQD